MIVYSDKFNNSEVPYSSYEFEVLNELKDCLNRRDSNCIQHTRFLFEMDNVSLEEQLTYLKRNKEYITRCVYSGSKSLHMIIQFPDDWESTCKDNYKDIWQILNTILFDSKCDYACSNPSRLTRRPNALRHDTNKIQKLLYNQPEIRLSDDIIDRIIVTLRSRLRQKRLFNAIRNNIRTASKDNPGICQNYDVIRHYLETSYPKLNGNGDSSISLFKAIRCCVKYRDKVTLKKVISKALVERWTSKEIQRMIDNIKCKYM